MNKPLLSVIIPNYNHGKFLQKSLDAICKQNVENFEIIVIDDKSTDNSIEIIKDFQKKYSNIKFFQNQKNIGPVDTINFGIKKSEGKYLAFCAADDIIYPNFFNDALDFLLTNPDAGICTSDTVYFFDESNTKILHKLLPTDTKTVIKDNEIIKLFRNSKFYIPTQSTIYKKDIVIQYMYDSSMKWYSDTYLSHIIALQSKVLYIPKVYAAMRKNIDCYSANKPFLEEYQVYKEILKKIDNESLELQRAFRKSGVLTQYNSNMFLFLLSKVRYWKYIPSFIIKRFINIFYKIKLFIKKTPFSKKYS